MSDNGDQAKVLRALVLEDAIHLPADGWDRATGRRGGTVAQAQK